MIPKSLHTVSALVAVARAEIRHAQCSGHQMPPRMAMQCALSILGYPPGTPDVHGLAAVALRKLEKEPA
jgi:hypothetical protein